MAKLVLTAFNEKCRAVFEDHLKNISFGMRVKASSLGIKEILEGNILMVDINNFVFKKLEKQNPTLLMDLLEKQKSVLTCEINKHGVEENTDYNIEVKLE